MAEKKPSTNDGLANVITGLGMPGMDKATGNSFIVRQVTPLELDAIYRSTFVGRKVIDIPAEDMTREWRRWQATKEQISVIEAEEKRLGLHGKVTAALRWARLYGGAAIILGDGAPDPTQPLDVRGKGGLKYIACVTCHQLTAGEEDADVASPYFGLPSYWTLNLRTGGIDAPRLHPSRIVRFIGAPRPPTATTPRDGWGDSVLMSAFDAIDNAATASTVIAHLLQEAKTDVVTIPDLADAIATTEGESRMIRRFTLAKMAKSVVNTLILGSGETYDQKTINFSGLPEIHIRFLQEASGAADMPVTRMLGQSPAGLNSTGDADLRNWYDKIAKDQANILRPAFDQIDAALLVSAFGSVPEDVFYTFPPLWQLTPEVAADVGLKKAQAFQIDVNSGIIPDEALEKGRVNQLIEDGTYPGFEVAIDEAREAAAALGEDDPDTDPADTPPVPSPAATAAQANVTGGEPRPVVLRVVGADGRPLTTDATPRSLYVRRDVRNWKDIADWAKGQGIKTTVGDAMHVTIMFSRALVDWMKIGNGSEWNIESDGGLIIKPGGVRLIERLGKATALLFSSSTLSWRHESIRYVEGVEWEWPDYQPHITLSWDVPDDLDLRAIEPYRGAIKLGPEIFEEVNEGWSATITEDGAGRSGLLIPAL